MQIFTPARSTLLAFILCALCSAQATAPPPRVQAMLASIAPSDLKGDLSFLASDALQGRFTPSPGLEVAAEFIASRFRAAGLEPGGNQDYFQLAAMVDRHLSKPQTSITIQIGARTLKIPPDAWQVYDAAQAALVQAAPVVVFASPDPEALKKTDAKGKAVIIVEPDFSKLPPDRRMPEYRKFRAFNRTARASGALVEVVVRQGPSQSATPRLLSAEDARRRFTPIVMLTNEDLLQKLQTSGQAAQFKTVSLDIPAPDDHPFTAKNVIAVLRGSDPTLKDTCVLLTAHYDHIGTLETSKNMSGPRPKDSTDRIYNGANDDGSGTVSVIAIARAFARLSPRPKRSVVFMAFFGEERGELGSKYYGDHPIFPISKTVADVNLEQVGRTDSTIGLQRNNASITGYDYSEVTQYLAAAGRQTGIRVYKDNEASDAYFTRSDNDALAEQGIPAHTLTVAFDFADYHNLGDEWQKVDYQNMARVDRMVALGLLNIANDPKVPQWNSANPKTAPFREARQQALSK